MKRVYVLLGIITGIVLCLLAFLIYIFKNEYSGMVYLFTLLLVCYLSFLILICFILKKEFELENKKRELELLDKELSNKKAYLEHERGITNLIRRENEVNEREKELGRLKENGLLEYKNELARKANQDSLISNFVLFVYSLRVQGKNIENLDLKAEFEKFKDQYQGVKQFISEFIEAD